MSSSAMSLLTYSPDDMTVTVAADMSLAALQAELRAHNQWLPVDPPNPDKLTINDLVSQNLSGPRRYGYGTIREHLLGLGAELANGKTIRAGGRVVKNAAGYDLCKLFIGAHGELGKIRDVTFKVRPLPETEIFLAANMPTLEAACDFAGKVDTSVVTPVVLDLHNLAPQTLPTWTVVVGLAGDREAVEWERQQIEQFGLLTATNLEYEQKFWTATDGSLPLRTISVLPSKLQETISGLNPHPSAVIARAGNGTVYYRGGPTPPARAVGAGLTKLSQRVKDAFNSSHATDRHAS